MSFRATCRLPGLYPTIAPIALSLLAACTAFGQRGGQKIEFSSPSSGLVASNLNQLGKTKSGGQQLEQDLFRPFESLNPDSSLGALATSPYRPPPSRSEFQSKRDKEKEDRLKNWVFMDPDDLAKEPSPEEIFGLKEYDKHGQEKKPLSAVERYYQKLDRQRSGTDERLDDKATGEEKEKDGFTSLRAVDRLEPLNGDDTKSWEQLKGLLNSNLDGKSDADSTSLGGLLFEQVKDDGFQTGWAIAREERVKEFERLLGAPSASPPLANSWNSFSLPNGRASPSLTPPTIYTGPRQLDTLSSAPSGLRVGPSAISGGFPDVNARSLSQPSLAPVVQPAPQPKAPTPSLAFPTRKF